MRNQNAELGVKNPSESDLSFTGQRILNILNRDPEKYSPEYVVKLQSSFPKEDSCQYELKGNELQEMTTSNDIDPQSDTEKPIAVERLLASYSCADNTQDQDVEITYYVEFDMGSWDYIKGIESSHR